MFHKAVVGMLYRLIDMGQQGSHGNHIHRVVIEHARQRTSVSSAKIIEIQPGNLVARYLFGSTCQAKNMLFQVLQGARFKPVPPQAACQRQQIQMSIITKRNRDVVQAITGCEQRRVKGLAIERNQGLGWSKKLGNRFQHGWFFRWVTQEELSQDKLVLYKTRDTNHEGIGP